MIELRRFLQLFPRHQKRFGEVWGGSEILIPRYDTQGHSALSPKANTTNPHCNEEAFPVEAHFGLRPSQPLDRSGWLSYEATADQGLYLYHSPTLIKKRKPRVIEIMYIIDPVPARTSSRDPKV